MNRIRWAIFCALSVIGWRICPEPQRSALFRLMPTWGGIERETADKLDRHYQEMTE